MREMRLRCCCVGEGVGPLPMRFLVRLCGPSWDYVPGRFMFLPGPIYVVDEYRGSVIILYGYEPA